MNTHLASKLKSVLPWLLIALVLCAPANAGVNNWTVGGPEGGPVEALAVHPTQPSIVITGGNNGIHRSADGGFSWTRIADPFIHARQITFDSSNPDRVFVHDNDTIYRSSNRGLTFQTLLKPCCLFVTAQAVASDGTVYISDRTGVMFRSTDHGDHWTEVTHPWGIQASSGDSEIFVDPANPNNIFYALYGLGIFKSVNAGASWTGPIASGPPATTIVNQFAVKPDDSSRMVAATSNGIYVSIDSGASWTQQIPGPSFYSVAFNPLVPNQAAILAAPGRVMRSTDGGITWPVTASDALLRTNESYVILFDPVTPTRMLVATNEGPWISTNSGASFQMRATGLHAESAQEFTTSVNGTLFGAFYGPFGLYRYGPSGWQASAGNAALRQVGSSAYVADIAVAGANDSTIYALNSAGRVLVKSADGGVTWSAPNAQLQASTSDIRQVVTDPSNPAIAYVLTANQGFWKTGNTGATWVHHTTGLPDSIFALAVDPSNSLVVYVSGNTSSARFTLKSLDGGVTWNPISSGLADAVVQQFIFDPSDPAVLYAVLVTQVYKSINGGASWTNFPNDGLTTRGLAIDPARPTTLWIAGSTAFGVGRFLRSVDGGTTWESVPGPLTSVHASIDKMALDPQRPNKILVVGFGTGVWEYEVAPDLDVSLVGFDQPFPVAGTAAARVRARNGSQLSSSASVLTISLPAHITSNVPADCARAANTLTCQVGILRGLQWRDFELSLTIGGTPGSGAVSASIVGHEPDASTANNTATITTRALLRNDLAVTISTGLTIGRGQSATTTATVTNNGPDVSHNTRLVFALSPTLTATAATSPAGPCTVTANEVTCNLGTMASGATTTAQLQLTGTFVSVGGFTSSVTSDGIDTGSDGGVQTIVFVQPRTDASVELATGAGSKVVATPFEVTATVRNNGPDPVAMRTSFSVTGASVVSATTTGGTGTCTVTSPTGSCNLNSLVSGATATITYTLSAATAGAVSVDTSVTFEGSEVSATNNSATLATTVTAAPPPPSGGGSSSGGGGGGGGRFDWAALLLLGLLARRRIR